MNRRPGVHGQGVGAAGSAHVTLAGRDRINARSGQYPALVRGARRRILALRLWNLAAGGGTGTASVTEEGRAPRGILAWIVLSGMETAKVAWAGEVPAHATWGFGALRWGLLVEGRRRLVTRAEC